MVVALRLSLLLLVRQDNRVIAPRNARWISFHHGRHCGATLSWRQRAAMSGCPVDLTASSGTSKNEWRAGGKARDIDVSEARAK